MQTHANGCALTTMIILLLSVCSLNELGLTFCDICSSQVRRVMKGRLFTWREHHSRQLERARRPAVEVWRGRFAHNPAVH